MNGGTGSDFKSALIFGASTAGRRTLEYYRTQFRIVGFVDSDRTKAGTQACGLPVYFPSQISDLDVDCVLIGGSYAPEIAVQLEMVGWDRKDIGWVHPEIADGVFEGIGTLRLVLRGLLIALIVGSFALSAAWLALHSN